MVTDRRHVRLVALTVTDPVAYGRYRAGMTPILESYGGRFGCDFVVAEVLLGAERSANRVFTIEFPDADAQQRFFADERYRAVRAEFFAPAVATTQVLAELESVGGSG